MADSFQDKTEKPTGKRLSDSRKKGSVAKSQDLCSAISLLTGTVGLMIFGPGMVEMMNTSFVTIITHMSEIQLTTDSLPGLLAISLKFFLQLLGPFLLTLMIFGIASHILQTGWVFADEALQPKLSNLSPLNGLKRIFSSRGAVELLKGIIKIVIVGWVGYVTVKGFIPNMIPLMDEEVGQLIAAIGHFALKLALRLTLAFAILAILDFAFQKWKYIKDLMMTKQEIKEEFRSMEGDPQIKGKIRQLQLKTSLNLMIKKIPEADVVLANPIHLAVALKYDHATMSAPQVIAKGKRKVAERIKEIARLNGIPVIEEPQLARALYKAAEVGQEVPYDLFQAVAEVLAMVYRLKNKRAA